VVHATECAASGTLDVIVCLAQELAAAGARQSLVYSPRAETPADLVSRFPPGVEFIAVDAARGLHVDFARDFHAALRHVMQTFQPDVLHLHSSKAGFVGRLARALHRWPCRVLYSPHGLSFLDPEARARNCVFRALEWLAARDGAVPVACGRGEAGMLTQLSRREALLLENCVDDFFLAVERQPSSVPTIVTVGRLSRQKAPDTFAAVARRLRADAPHARFVWVGDGESHYRGLLEASGCEVTGWCNREAVAGHLSRAHLYLQTSRWEGLPIAVIQALAAGVPCVVNDCAGNRDAVADGVDGFVADSESALAVAVARLLADEHLRLRFGAAARVEARRRFSRAAFGVQVRRLYGITDSRAAAGAWEAHAVSA
jgi:glycosyltransferase involved in cell wall biosynthesis